jgi:nitrogen fixation/metabolism regulation signal transduction histidine kinase
MIEGTTTAEGPARHQRSAKNYLLDRHFQLKYTGFLVGIALFLSIALGLLLWSTSSQVIRQSQRAVDQGRETVKQSQSTVARGQQVVQLSRKVSQVVSMNIAKEYKDDPELAKTFGEEAQKDEARLKDEQAKLEKDEAFLQQRAHELSMQASEVATQQKVLLGGLVAALALLVLGIGIAGIVFTHKIAGPIFKMKRLLRQVGEGKLVVRERLRKGDELQHFFESFEKMVDDLRARQEEKIAKVDAILARLDEAPVSQRGHKEVDEDGVALLKRLRRELAEQIDA